MKKVDIFRKRMRNYVSKNNFCAKGFQSKNTFQQVILPLSRCRYIGRNSNLTGPEEGALTSGLPPT